jgi:hypothetical protein
VCINFSHLALTLTEPGDEPVHLRMLGQDLVACPYHGWRIDPAALVAPGATA